jgi:hypothetical protein
MDPKHLQAGSKAIPEVGVQLGRTRLALQTRACVQAHCLARLLSVQTGAIGPGSNIVVRLPGLPHGQPRVIDVPSDGLGPALAELLRLNQS